MASGEPLERGAMVSARVQVGAASARPGPVPDCTAQQLFDTGEKGDSLTLSR